MWNWMKYLYIAIRLGVLFENLKAVKAKDPATTTASYEPAAAVLLSDPSVQKFVARLSPEEQTSFVANLPTFVFMLDFMTE